MTSKEQIPRCAVMTIKKGDLCLSSQPVVTCFRASPNPLL